MKRERLHLHWLFNRSVGRSLLLVTLILVVAFLINLTGIGLLGGIESWAHWIGDHTGYFLAWRLLLYAGLCWGWLRMRRRLLTREPGTAARQRLQRAEIAAVLALIALESSAMLQFY